jgi:H+/gluconate symporter-like permease
MGKWEGGGGEQIVHKFLKSSGKKKNEWAVIFTF